MLSSSNLIMYKNVYKVYHLPTPNTCELLHVKIQRPVKAGQCYHFSLILQRKSYYCKLKAPFGLLTIQGMPGLQKDSMGESGVSWSWQKTTWGALNIQPVFQQGWLHLKAAPERGWPALFLWSGRSWWAVERGSRGRTAQNKKTFWSVSPVSDASSVNLMTPLGHKLVLYLAEKVRRTWGFLLHSSNEEDTFFFFLFWKNLQGDFRGSQISKAPFSYFWLMNIAFPGMCACVCGLFGVFWLQFP